MGLAVGGHVTTAEKSLRDSVSVASSIQDGSKQEALQVRIEVCEQCYLCMCAGLEEVLKVRIQAVYRKSPVCVCVHARM